MARVRPFVEQPSRSKVSPSLIAPARSWVKWKELSCWMWISMTRCEKLVKDVPTLELYWGMDRTDIRHSGWNVQS